jgi:hypothetical protein
MPRRISGKGHVLLGGHDSGPRMGIQMIKPLRKEIIIPRQGGRTPKLPIIWQDLAYSQPQLFEMRQRDNGHQDAEEKILTFLMDYVGGTVVSLACGSGGLDRRLLINRAKDLINGKSTLRLLGVDSSPESVENAENRMRELLDRNRELKRCNEDGRFVYQYTTAMLGGSSPTVRDFASIDLRRETILECNYPDTFVAFMAFVLWVRNKQDAISSIVDKCRRPVTGSRPTFFINGEEYPTHLTRNPFVIKDPLTTRAFRQAVLQLKAFEVSTETLWGELFERNGLKRIAEGSVNLGQVGEDHIMRYAVLRYFGKPPFIK